MPVIPYSSPTWAGHPGCDCASCRQIRGEDVDEPYACPTCGATYAEESEAEECCAEYFYCPDCGERWSDSFNARECCRSGDGDYGSDYPPLPELENVYQLIIPAIPARPARICSIEQELVDGGNRAARVLYDFGYSSQSERSGYSADSRRGQAIVKEDGSLPDSGGEIVYSRYRLDDNNQAENLSAALARIRQLKDAGLVATGMAAGTHIHISAQAENGETFMPQHMASLHELFCHLEDTLYAIAACGWHAHRLDPYGEGYCKTLPKVLDSTPAKVTQAMRSDRYYGLNFQRLYEAVAECRCGASLVGDWGACDCGTMESATVEWRLFNSSTKPETLHAWLLIAHALTAYAAKHKLGTLEPVLARTGTPESRWTQLRWMLRVCPFTVSERKVIRDAARRSPGFGDISDDY